MPSYLLAEDALMSWPSAERRDRCDRGDQETFLLVCIGADDSFSGWSSGDGED